MISSRSSVAERIGREHKWEVTYHTAVVVHWHWQIMPNLYTTMLCRVLPVKPFCYMFTIMLDHEMYTLVQYVQWWPTTLKPWQNPTKPTELKCDHVFYCATAWEKVLKQIFCSSLYAFCCVFTYNIMLRCQPFKVIYRIARKFHGLDFSQLSRICPRSQEF